jgi:hypothetical protein
MQIWKMEYFVHYLRRIFSCKCIHWHKIVGISSGKFKSKSKEKEIRPQPVNFVKDHVSAHIYCCYDLNQAALTLVIK